MILKDGDELQKQFAKLKGDFDLSNEDFNEICHMIDMIAPCSGEVIWQNGALVPPAPYGSTWQEKLKRNKELEME